MNITHTINQLPIRAKKLLLKSLVASLNQSIIGYARSHLRTMKYPKRDEVNTLDRFNEQYADADIAKATDEFMGNAGLVVPDSPFVLCQRFSMLRNWLEEMIQNCEPFNPEYDSPFTVGNSLAYQIDRAPLANLAELKLTADATGISLDRLISVGTQKILDDHTDLVENKDHILAIYDECTDKHSVWDEQAVEILINQLPVQSQYKMGIKVNEILIKAGNDAVKLMLTPRQRGSSEAAGDVKIIDVARAEHFDLLQKFDRKHAAALDAFAERGFLPCMPEAFDQPVVVAMDVQSHKEALSETKAPVPAPTPVPIKAVKAAAVAPSKLDKLAARFNGQRTTSI